MISFLPVNICHFKMLFNKKTYHFYFISIVLYCLHYFGWKCQQQLSALVHFIKVSDITLISETFSYLSHVTFPYFTSTAWILWKLVSATGYFFKGNCNISQFRTHNLKFLKRLHCKNKIHFFLYNNLLISWQKWNAYWKRATGFHQRLHSNLYCTPGMDLSFCTISSTSI